MAAGQAAASGRAHLQARPARLPQLVQGEGEVWPAVNVRGHGSRVVARSASGCCMERSTSSLIMTLSTPQNSGISRGEGRPSAAKSRLHLKPGVEVAPQQNGAVHHPSFSHSACAPARGLVRSQIGGHLPGKRCSQCRARRRCRSRTCAWRLCAAGARSLVVLTLDIVIAFLSVHGRHAGPSP